MAAKSLLRGCSRYARIRHLGPGLRDQVTAEHFAEQPPIVHGMIRTLYTRANVAIGRTLLGWTPCQCRGGTLRRSGAKVLRSSGTPTLHSVSGGACFARRGSCAQGHAACKAGSSSTPAEGAAMLRQL